MKIVMLSQNCCIRVIKEGTALQACGHEVIYLHNLIRNEELADKLSLESRWKDLESMISKLIEFKPDIVHAHAEPADFVTIAHHALPDTPVVFDVHDCELMRSGRSLEAEEKAWEYADGFIHPSNGYREGILSRRPETSTRPHMTLYPHLAKWMFPQGDPLPHVGGLVYEGGVLASEDSQGTIKYRDFRDVVKRCNSQGIPFFIHPAGPNTDHIMEVDGMVFGRLGYYKLLRHMSRYSFGLVAPGNFPEPHMEVCMPNKLFEYLAAGLPIVTWGCKEVMEFVESWECGVALKNPDELTSSLWKSLLKRRRTFIEAVRDVNNCCMMEIHVPSLIRLYEAARRCHDERA